MGARHTASPDSSLTNNTRDGSFPCPLVVDSDRLEGNRRLVFGRQEPVIDSEPVAERPGDSVVLDASAAAFFGHPRAAVPAPLRTLGSREYPVELGPIPVTARRRKDLHVGPLAARKVAYSRRAPTASLGASGSPLRHHSADLSSRHR